MKRKPPRTPAPPPSPAEARRKRSWIAHRILLSLGFIPIAWESRDAQIHVEHHDEEEPAFRITHAASDQHDDVPTKDLGPVIERVRAALEREER